jgi:ABC-type bacteriocin/lantibiotic exporter with double-glycine peptidase domain
MVLMVLVLSAGHLIVDDSAIVSPAAHSEPQHVGPSGTARLYRSLAADRNCCGTNALYVFVHLLSKNVPYQEIERYAPRRDSGGTSFLQMKQACEAFGLRVKVIEVEQSALSDAKFPLPAVMHNKAGPGVAIGHFIVLLKVDGDSAWYIDGTSGALGKVPWHWLSQKLSGYGLVAYPAASESTELVLPAAVEMSIILVALCLWSVAKFARRRFGAVTIFALAQLPPLVAGPPSAPPPNTRAAGLDAANVLYLFLRLSKINVTCDQARELLAARVHNESLLDIRNAAQSAGVQCALLKLKPAMLESFPTPFVTEIDRGGHGHGTFVIVHYASDRYVDLVDGNMVAIRRVPFAQFVDQWSGTALVSRPPAISWSLLWMIFLSGAAAACAASIFWQWRWPGHAGLSGRT